MPSEYDNMVLQVLNLDVYYGELQAVKDISLNILKAQIIALIGSNGAGKSTLLKAISGILPVRTGQIRFCGKDISHLAPERIVKLGLSQVPERRRLFDVMSVMDNLLLGTYGWSRRKRKEEIGGTLASVFGLFPILKEKHDQPAHTLSGGRAANVSYCTRANVKTKTAALRRTVVRTSPITGEGNNGCYSSLVKRGPKYSSSGAKCEGGF